MKKILLILCCVLPIMCLADEDCDQALREAKSAYNAANYSKAKGLFDYVVSECGSSYGNASSWSQKCQAAIKPNLSVSSTSVSIGSSSGSTSITVTSNRNWKLRHTNSDMFSISKSENTVIISYYANASTSSRSDYFEVVTTDESKSARVTITQSGASITPTLSISESSISCSSYGTTKTITVTSNTTWEIQYPSGTMYSATKNGNRITVVINENTSSESRSDYFNVKTTDGSKVQKITLSQTGKSSSSGSSYAVINKVWLEHKVYVDGKRGMKIHVKFDAYNVLNHAVKPCAFFSFKNGNDLKGIKGSDYITPDGYVTVQKKTTASYANTSWSDFVMFIPYENLNMASGCNNVSLECEVGIYDSTTNEWLTSTNTKVSFTFSN